MKLKKNTSKQKLKLTSVRQKKIQSKKEENSQVLI